MDFFTGTLTNANVYACNKNVNRITNGSRSLANVNVRLLAVRLSNFLMKIAAFAFHVNKCKNKNVTLENSGILKLVNALACHSAVRVE